MGVFIRREIRTNTMMNSLKETSKFRESKKRLFTDQQATLHDSIFEHRVV